MWVKSMRLNEHELLALLTGLNSLTRETECTLDTDVSELYNKIEEAYYRTRRSYNYECDI